MTKNLYEQRLKFIKVGAEILRNMESGGYISFAVCSFYKDETFSEFVYKILDSVISLDWKEL